jgi:protein CWC15
MTTAHRPTWKAAVGRSDEGGWSAGGARSAAVSALDAPAHTSLKFRSGGAPDRRAVIQQSLAELERAEKKRPNLPRRELDAEAEEQGQLKLLKQSAEVDDAAIRAKYDDSDVDRGGGSEDEGKSGGSSDEESDLDDSDDGSSSDEDEGDEDEEALLQAELAKIRAEREQAQKKAQEELDREEQAKEEEAALLGNPLLNPEAASRPAKRRWNDDVVFRNQAKGEPAPKKRFVNDTVRNDFHKRFLNKFIR